jgi:hypothetical protein
MVGVQVWANAKSTAADKPQSISHRTRVFIWRLKLLKHFQKILPS